MIITHTWKCAAFGCGVTEVEEYEWGLWTTPRTPQLPYNWMWVGDTAICERHVVSIGPSEVVYLAPEDQADGMN